MPDAAAPVPADPSIVPAAAAFDLGVAARRAEDRETAVGYLRQALAADPAHRAARIELAAALRELGQPDAAEAEYRVLLAEQPGGYVPLLGLGLCARLRRDLPAALGHLAAANAVAPAGEPWSRLEYATVLRELGRADEAEAVYDALLAERPGWVLALIGSAQCARLRRDLPAAAERFAAVLALAPEHRGAWFDYATVLRELGRLEQAEAQYRLLLAAHPGWFPALLGLGQCARLRRDLPAAADLLAAAVAAAPDTDRWSRLDYATVLRELGRADAAEAMYRAVLAGEPEYVPALLGLGLCARLRRDLPAAAGHFAAAVAAAPRDRAARLEYAAVLRELGRAEAAETVYHTLLADEPGLMPALLGLGLCARLRRNLPAAAMHLAAAVAAAPANDRWPRLEYATVLRELGRAEEAEALYRAVLADEPGYVPALLGLGLCARLRLDRATALAMFQAAADAAPDAMAAWLEILSEHTDAGRFDAARAVAGSMLQRDPAAAQVWVGLGRLERLAGNRAAALDAYRQGAARCPDMPYFLVEMAIEAQALGRFAEAEQWLLQAAENDATAGWALTQLGDNARAAQRLEAALELFRRAVVRPGAPLGAHVSLAQSLAELGQFDEALEVLAAAERQAGARPELATMRAGLLRRAGLRQEALAVARAASAAAPAYFPLWQERFENERFAGTLDGLDALLDAAPVANQRERAALLYARGLLAEQRWALDSAAAAFREAVALDPAMGWVHQALARVSLLIFDIASTREHLLANVRLDSLARQARRGPLRITQTHLGQILEEFLIDTAALAALTDAQALPPAARVARLLPLAQSWPDHTPTAIALLIALRQAGRFERRPDGQAGAPAGGRIPPRIVQYWYPDAPPADIARLMQSWQDHNPGHAYIRFDDAAAQAFLAAHCAPEVLQAYDRAEEPAKKADVFRLAYLSCEGGVYADADDRCLRPLADFVPPHADLVVHQEEYGTLGNNFIAVGPSHPVIDLALRAAVLSVNRGDEDLLWLATGPGLITRSFAHILASDSAALETWLARTAILHRHELAHGVAAQCLAGYKTTPRNWFRAAFVAPAPAAGHAAPDPLPLPSAAA